MRKRFLYGKKVLAVVAAISIMSASLTGCGSPKSSSLGSDAEVVMDTAGDDEDVVDTEDDVLAATQSDKVASGASATYNKGSYDLPKDYVFEFEASQSAGDICNDVFKVYDTDDLSREIKKSYCWNTYENGVIKVAPDDVFKLDGGEGQTDKDGTWGSMNQLYLVQYVDLQTGEELADPIITPFTVKHDLKSPAVGQGVDEKNNYVLKWKTVNGAKEYAVYEKISDTTYVHRTTTSDTSVNSRSFDNQAETENLLELFKNDLQNEGMEVDQEGIIAMNSGVDVSENAGRYVVVAIGDGGKVSGMSNIVDARDIASNLPSEIKDKTIELAISSIEDMPTYVDVQMVDGSVTQMVIDYHGAQAYKYPDDPNKITIRAHVANTEFDSFLITLTGMKYEDVVAQKDYFLQREDKILENIRPAEIDVPTIEIVTDESDEPVQTPTEEVTEEPTTEEVTETPTEEVTEEPTTEEVTEAPTTEEVTEAPTTEEVTEAPTEEATTEEKKPSEDKPAKTPGRMPAKTAGSTKAEQLMNEVEDTVASGINALGEDKVNKVLYANSDLGAWMAYCLIAQNEVIPVPTSVFPEAANTELLLEVLLEAYRQNPTCGMIDIQALTYNSELEALKVAYIEDRDTRLKKTKMELEKAEEVAGSVCNASMSDYDKVVALNEHFRINASYDHDSMATDVDIHSLSESFMDAHTPYGILCNNYGVCESYSEAFILSSRMAGLESIAEVGTLYGGGHEWNRVKVDGTWCVLDITNNDNDELTNGLLNVSDEQIDGVLVPSRGYMVDTTPFAATSSDKEYYYVNGLAASSLDEAKTLIMDVLSKESKATVRVPAGTSEDEVKELFNTLVQEGAPVQSGNYAFGIVHVE